MPPARRAKTKQDGDMSTLQSIHLQVLLPTDVLVDETVVKVIAEAHDGEFCLLPRHIDFVAALVPGVLYFYNSAGAESYAAIDAGILLKCGSTVSVSCLNGVRGASLAQLRKIAAERFLALDERERNARAALARLEAGTLRRFRDLQQHTRG